MANSDSVLTKLCSENVYMDNLFHILGVGIDVTPRKLRRRREDIDSAHEFGEDAWRNQFKHLLGNCEIPTYQEVCDAFARIENPEERIVSEFFWFWPTGDGDSSLDDLLAGRKLAAIKAWENGEYAYGKARTISIHNLAVVYHLYAIDAELQAIADGGKVPDDYHSKMCSYWDKSFSYWEQLADNDDFWDLFAARIKEFDDPRLTDDFVRRFRAEFPVAFDNINAHIAAEYAKLGAYTDAERHVNYMLKTMSGMDDVQSTLNVLFEPMESMVKRLINNFDSKVAQSPRQGLECTKSLLAETDEIRRVAVGLLSEGQKIRTGLLSEIAWACNRYQVAYGSETKDWEACLDVLEQLRSLACTPELKKTIGANIATISKNIEFKKLEDTCLCCGKANVKTKKTVHLHTRITFEDTWRNLDIDVAMCNSCKLWHSLRILISAVLCIGIGILLGVWFYNACNMGSYYSRYRNDTAFGWLIFADIILCLVGFNFYLHVERDKIFRLKRDPRIASARDEKFHYGAMSQDLARSIVWIRDRVIGWGIMLIIIGIIGGLATICGC